MHIKTIWVYGVGGVGGVIGGKIAHSLEKEHHGDVAIYFVARGEHLKEIQKNGLILNMGNETGLICTPTLATDDIKELPSPDLCFICVKSYDLDAVSRSLHGSIQDEAVIIPLLNGIDIYERMRKVVKDGVILPACIYVGTHIEKPGVITQKGGEGKILMGGDPKRPDFCPEEILRFLTMAAIPFQWFEDASPAIWEKYLFIAGFSLVGVAYRKTLGEIMVNAGLKRLVTGIIEEIVLIARKKHIGLPADIVALSVAKANNFPYETKTSYQRDLEHEGKQNEGDLFGTTILRIGKELGVPTPVTESIYNKILTGASL